MDENDREYIMSKIEKALNKARKNAKNAMIVSGQENPKQNAVSDISYLSPVKTNITAPEPKRYLSTKEIALMKESNLLDEKQLAELKIIHSDMKNKKIANSYRDLRTQLLQKNSGKNFIAMLTSCYSGYDSGTVAINLARAFSFDDSKTSLLIDCDFNEPVIDELLDSEFSTGLTDYLHDETLKVEETIHSTGIKRLRVIPAGTSIGAAIEYFTSRKIKELMKELLDRYPDRYIFMNSAPILQSADTRILVELADYVLLVVPHGRVTKKTINAAVDAIGKEKLLGVVFNDAPKMPVFRIPGFSRLSR